MNITIYIRKENEPRFSEEVDKSKLVNELLANYYAGSSPERVKPHTAPKLPNQPVKEPPVNGFPCCQSKTARCKHWQWDGVKEGWLNLITGELKDG